MEWLLNAVLTSVGLTLVSVTVTGLLYRHAHKLLETEEEIAKDVAASLFWSTRAIVRIDAHVCETVLSFAGFLEIHHASGNSF